jgi:hypothetical protein
VYIRSSYTQIELGIGNITENKIYYPYTTVPKSNSGISETELSFGLCIVCSSTYGF